MSIKNYPIFLSNVQGDVEGDLCTALNLHPLATALRNTCIIRVSPEVYVAFMRLYDDSGYRFLNEAFEA